MITLPNSPEVMAAVLLPLKEGRPVQFAMTGESMEPTIHGERDVIVLSPLPQALRRGDVVLYKRGMQHVLHRILRAKGDFLVVRGDSCREKERVSRDEVVALLVQIKHADGTVVSCCDNQWRSASRKAMRLNAMRQWGRRYFSKEMRNRFLP
ncbi:MAG: S24/S26 family peptidase [Bacteroidales bacterium]|nr:S24/S26 family peptidase [Bacteroidales bacterium]